MDEDRLKWEFAGMFVAKFDNCWDMKKPVLTVEQESRLPDSSWSQYLNIYEDVVKALWKYNKVMELIWVALAKRLFINVIDVRWKTSDVKFIIEMLQTLQHMDPSHSLNCQFSNNFM